MGQLCMEEEEKKEEERKLWQWREAGEKAGRHARRKRPGKHTHPTL